MSKSTSPDNIPLPFFEQSTPAAAPKEERILQVASFMIDSTEPVHSFSDQPPKIEKVLESDSNVSTGTPRYDVVLDPEASEAAQDQGWGRMPVFRKPEVLKPEKQTKTSTRPIESKTTGYGQEPPASGPSTTPLDKAVPMPQEVRDFGRNLEIEKIREKHSQGGKELTLEQAAFIYDNRPKNR